MHLLSYCAIFMSILSILYGTQEFVKDRHKGANCIDVILISIIMLSLLNIVICTILINADMIPVKILCYLAFGSISHQSILSLFTINYIKRNNTED